jgi:hypothetical protein
VEIHYALKGDMAKLATKVGELEKGYQETLKETTNMKSKMFHAPKGISVGGASQFPDMGKSFSSKSPGKGSKLASDNMAQVQRSHALRMDELAS